MRSLISHAVFGLAVASTACNAKTESGEQQFVEGEVRELKAALASRSISGVQVGCITTTTSLPRLPAKLAKEIEQLCYVEAPRLYLETSVADASKSIAEHPGMDDISCMQLFAEDAFKTIALHPPADPGLQKLVDEYTRLCPKQVAKFRVR